MAIIFSQNASFGEQILRTISLSEIDTVYKLLVKVTTQVTKNVIWCF